MAIVDRFKILASRIQPLESEVDAATSHLGTVRTRISAVFTVNKFVTVGSHARETSIRGFSDADLLTVFPRDEMRWGDSYMASSTVLDNVKRQLQARYKFTPIYRDVHSIVLDFADYSVDVVPSFFLETTRNGWPMYAMPDGNGSWMKTCPELHAKYIKDANFKSGGKLRIVAQLLKFWRECREPRIPISSFYIEMLLASEEVCKGIKSYE